MSNPITRRNALGACAALAPAAASAAAKAIPIGIATNDFRDHSNSSLAKELATQRIKLIQLFFTQTDTNYWKYGGRSDLPGLTPEKLREIAAVYRSEGISIHSMGVYTTLIHPDPSERKANLAYFEAMFKAGGQIGVRKFVSEAGHYQPPGPAPGVAFDLQDEVWTMAVATVKELARIAEAHDAVVMLEPIYRSIFASAKRTRVFIEEVGSPRIRVNLDPANLLEANDLEEMFDQLGRWVDCIHAKDRKLHVSLGVPAGEGDIDYPKFVNLAAKRTPGVPLIVEYVGSKNYRQALAHLREVMAKAGLKEA